MICNLKPVLRCVEGVQTRPANENLERLGWKLKVTSAYHLNAVAKS